MRVLAFFLNNHEYGEVFTGVERRFLEVSTHLRKLGAEIFALEYESFHSEMWGQHGYFPVKIKRRLSNHNVLSALRTTMLGLMACLKYRCEVIYVTWTKAWGHGSGVGLVAPYVVSCLCRKPLAVLFHHIEPTDFGEKNPIKLRAYRKAVCMAVSDATAIDVKKCFHVKEVTVVGNGVNSDLLEISNPEDTEYNAVFLGRIAESKGVFDLLKAWKKVVEERPSANLLLIGGFDLDARKLRRAIEEAQLAQNVTVSGFVSDEKMLRLLKSSKIFVFPSLREGFGLAVAEAMAAGLPCIISDIPALKEIYSAAAVLVQPGNPECLADAIAFLMSNPDKRLELQKRGQRLVRVLSWEKVARREFEVLKSLREH